MGILLFKNDTTPLNPDLQDFIKIRSELPKTVEPSNGFKYVIYNYYIRGNSDYTQGFYVMKDVTPVKILQSTGEYGKSKIMYNSLDEDNFEFRTDSKIDLTDNEFGEGAEVIEGKVVQLTWRENKVFIRNLETLAIEKTLTFPSPVSEGWEITYDSVRKDVYITDGSKNVYVCKLASDFSTLTVSSTVATQYSNINELEWV